MCSHTSFNLVALATSAILKRLSSSQSVGVHDMLFYSLLLPLLLSLLLHTSKIHPLITVLWPFKVHLAGFAPMSDITLFMALSSMLGY